MIVTTTALLRPKLLEKTYKSFSNNFNPFPKNLIISFNALPDQTSQESDIQLDKCLQICYKYFDTVKYELLKPSHSRALKYVWSNIKDNVDYVLHIEDDWLLNFNVDFNQIEKEHKKLNWTQIVLRSYFRKDFNFMLTPSIIKASFCKDIIQDIPKNINPEHYIRKKIIKNKMRCKIYAYPEKIKEIIVEDIGEKWKKENNYKWGGIDYKRSFTIAKGKPKLTNQSFKARLFKRKRRCEAGNKKPTPQK